MNLAVLSACPWIVGLLSLQMLKVDVATPGQNVTPVTKWGLVWDTNLFGKD